MALICNKLEFVVSSFTVLFGEPFLFLSLRRPLLSNYKDACKVTILAPSERSLYFLGERATFQSHRARRHVKLVEIKCWTREIWPGVEIFVAAEIETSRLISKHLYTNRRPFQAK